MYSNQYQQPQPAQQAYQQAQPVDTSDASKLKYELQLAQIKADADFALTEAGQQTKLIQAQSAAEFALTPAGQYLKTFETQQRIGQMFAQSDIIPANYRGNISNCAIAVGVALNLHIDPMLVMQNLNVIQGRPAWSSKFLIGTVNACGRYEPFRFRIVQKGMVGKISYTDYDYDERLRRKVSVVKTFDGSKLPNLTCVAWTRAKGSDETLESPEISLIIAVKEGWYTKNGSKWATMPELMLRYRAASMWVNTNDPGLSMGFATREEVEDISYTDMTTGETHAAPAKATIRSFKPSAATNTAILDIAKANAAAPVVEEAKEATIIEPTAAAEHQPQPTADPQSQQHSAEGANPKSPEEPALKPYPTDNSEPTLL